MKSFALIVINFLFTSIYTQTAPQVSNQPVKNVVAGLSGAILGVDDPDVGKSTPELIRSKGYPVESHAVITPDNYVLTLHRIPNGNGYNGDKTLKPVVLLQHGVFGCSEAFVVNFQNSSPGFILYDKGYDVWLGNVRGNSYSRNNTKISPSTAEFWQYTWDEHSLIDLPSMIDYILETTSRTNISYLGHSMGTTMAFALMSEKPEYQKKLNCFLALAPIATLHDSTNPAFQAYLVRDVLRIAFKPVTKGEFLSQAEPYASVIKVLCTDPTQPFCGTISGAVVGNGKYMNESRSEVYLKVFPDGTSIYLADHYLQQKAVTPSFRKYDFGPLFNYKTNQQAYNSSVPPSYDLSKITDCPVGLFSSIGDDVAVQTDIDFIRANLPKSTIVKDWIIDDKEFGHSIFILAVYLAKDYYEEVVNFLNSHNP